MTELLQKAFEQAAKLPESEQDTLASWLLAEFEAERRWDHEFSRSAEELATLAGEALEEYDAGKTKALDPDSL